MLRNMQGKYEEFISSMEALHNKSQKQEFVPWWRYSCYVHIGWEDPWEHEHEWHGFKSLFKKFKLYLCWIYGVHLKLVVLVYFWLFSLSNIFICLHSCGKGKLPSCHRVRLLIDFSHFCKHISFIKGLLSYKGRLSPYHISCASGQKILTVKIFFFEIWDLLNYRISDLIFLLPF